MGAPRERQRPARPAGIGRRPRHPARRTSSTSTTRCSSTATRPAASCATATTSRRCSPSAGRRRRRRVGRGRLRSPAGHGGEGAHVVRRVAHVWGVPTFVVGDAAVFVRLLELPEDGAGGDHHRRAGPRPVGVADPQRVQAHVDPALTAPGPSPRRRRCARIGPWPTDRRMSDAEGLMWRLEKDPYLSSTFATLSILDRPPDFDRLRARMERAAVDVPRLRWRVQPAPVNLSAPTVGRRSRLRHRPARPPHRPGQAGLDAPAARPGDAARRSTRSSAPGRCGSSSSSRACAAARRRCWQKMHHTITDGEGGVQMSLQYLDFERDAPDPEPVDPTATTDAEPATTATVDARHRPRPAASAGSGCRSASSARSASCSPTRRPSRPPARPPSTPSGASSRSSPTSRRPTRRCGPSGRCAAGWRTVRAPFTETKRRRQAARRHAEHGLPHRRGRGRRPLPHGARRARRGPAGVDGDQHPHRVLRRQRLLAEPA